ncbi:His Kinase A (phospho-acceptor) domain-containing protein [Paracidovorax cattleyae]|uniref:histidine kinase n=2 Tax=Paracidovorax cattleyae TaxID=80868 RepID=A0A1H0UZM8_9BURK|nr:His Kinase A (phospho-acceptor) domain-containing protein [Paracidovorax cattleyae]
MFSLAGTAQADDRLTLIQFMPAGEFGPSDGRTMDVPAWRIDADSARSVIAQHAARRNPVVIDHEHQTLLKEQNGQPTLTALGPLRPLQDRATAACTALALPTDTSAEAVTAACTSLRTNGSGTPDPARYVPVAVVDELRPNLAALLSRDGRLPGMLNNHYRWPGGPVPDALCCIDPLARQAVELVERHQIEAELAQERRRKDEFLAMLAHELRNPLAPLRNMLEVLGRYHGDEALSRKARDVMEGQVLQLVRLMDGLLDVNRIKRGTLELQREPLLLAEVINQAVEVCRPALDQQGHRLRVVLPGAPVPLQGDSSRLTQVFGNLLANACKYTPAGGDIEVRVEPAGPRVEVVVKDNGSGIPPEQIDEVFGLFTWVDRTLDRAQGGLGIGLMLVRRLVESAGS